MQLTAAMLTRISKVKPPAANVNAIVVAVNEYGARFGLDQPHRLAQFIAQLMHESGGLKFFKEIWGPTPAQLKYEGRRDLGNTKKGDGSLFRGYGPIQLTGRRNVTLFHNWCIEQGLNPPDFLKDPSKIATSPWAGLSAIWFWNQGNMTGKSLNKYADGGGDIEMITLKVNGGRNGLDDRIDYFGRTALVFLGYGVKEIEKFQADEKLEVDGEIGPKTRQAFQKELLKLSDANAKPASVMSAPTVQKQTKVVETTVEVAKPVEVKNLKKPFWQSREFFATVVTGGGLTGGSQIMDSAGNLPAQNLIILVVAAFVALGVFLWWSRRADRHEQRAKVAQINAENPST